MYFVTWDHGPGKRILTYNRMTKQEFAPFNAGIVPGGAQDLVACGNHTVAFHLFGSGVAKNVVLVQNLPRRVRVSAVADMQERFKSATALFARCSSSMLLSRRIESEASTLKIKPLTLVLIILMQVGFIAYGLALTFWTINEWLSDEKLNALFGGFIGALFFFIAWRLLRRWARRYFGLANRN